MINSTQNRKLKLIRSLLGRPRERLEADAFVVEGIRLLEEAVAAGWPFKFVLIGETLSDRAQALVEKLRFNVPVLEQVSDPLMNSVSAVEISQGILGVMSLPHPEISPSYDFVLIPDSIRDPGNLGSLLRSAAAAGVQAVFLPPETTDPFAPKVVRSGMGAHFKIPIHSMNWDEIYMATKQLKIFLADTSGTPCWETDFSIPFGLIVGGEADGATPSARALTDQTITIPMPGNVDSLNAAVAGAVLLFEAVRQRQFISR